MLGAGAPQQMQMSFGLGAPIQAPPASFPPFMPAMAPQFMEAPVMGMGMMNPVLEEEDEEMLDARPKKKLKKKKHTHN